MTAWRSSLPGVRLEIVWVPSEAPDEIAVWLPRFGVLQSAECVQGECYPNLYTLRGDVPRPAAQWVRSLDVLRTFPGQALTELHGRPGRPASWPRLHHGGAELLHGQLVLARAGGRR